MKKLLEFKIVNRWEYRDCPLETIYYKTEKDGVVSEYYEIVDAREAHEGIYVSGNTQQKAEASLVEWMDSINGRI